MAARQHRILGNIDLKLAMVMVIGTLVGSETGVDAIEALKQTGAVNLVVGVTAIVIFTGSTLSPLACSAIRRVNSAWASRLLPLKFE